jgi:alkylation response protein AidB-like acyl-CoA dehydrogenase
MTTALKTLESSKKAVGPLPVPNGDFYQVTECLSDGERAILKNVRAFMETKVAPTISKYWAEDSFPSELASGMRELKIAGAGYEGYGCAGGSVPKCQFH